MSIELQILASVVIALGVVASGYWAIAVLVVKQFEKRLDERFATQEAARVEGRKAWEVRFSRMEDEHRQLERDVLKLRADLPLSYVRREDYVRNQTVIEAKLDALALRFENAVLKGGRGD